ncbi:MAG: hypothetical protein GY947_07495 [Rhodobacteraceae bacterium]|nr:hypothetical protein [Paracoccaceae bacterium]
MAKVVGDVAVSVGADIGPLQQNMRKAGKELQNFQSRGVEMGKKIAKVGAIVAAATAAAGAAVLKAGRSASAAAVEINNLSKVANAGTGEFQRWAVAAETVNISQEKLSDILKDVNDRVGDFLATGGGPMKDFFENIAPLVGVTADQFKNLSGPEALQLYVSSLEKANVNQQQMTFYLEAMASDTTALIPLLANGGREIKRLGDEAQRSGQILDDDLIQAGVQLDKVLDDAARTIKTGFNKAILENADEIERLSNFISESLIPAMSSVVSKIGEISGAVSSGIGALREYFGIAAGLQGFDGPPALLSNNGYVPEDDDGTPSTTGLFTTGPDGKPIELGLPTTKLPGAPPSVGGSSGGGGGGRSGPSTADLEALQEQFLSEQELLEQHYQESLAKLEEFRNAKLSTEQEFNELEANLKADHLKSLEDLELKAQRARMQALSGAFSDLSGLMQSNSKKMFAIGKAAAVAESVVSGYQAAVDAWRHGMKIGGPPMAAAFTAASLAKTGALIASIKSQQPNGGGGGGYSGGGGGGTSAAPASTQDAYFNVSLVGEGNIGRGSIRDLIEQINDAIDDGAVLKHIGIEA